MPSDIIAVVSQFVSLQQGLRAYWGRCPFHDERGMTHFSVNPATQRFYCFGCGRGGGVDDFLRYIEERGKQR
ncbi:hypothetical protein BZM27_12605 [Paraburkholderia steynii]|uniref:Zinc finger CHC2-type domain-containing protein n=1 Tax=Paraburkholderia steynii TaxID=1245441 RepID=A0A4R0XM53_9BURK|nr:hypothetical protein BZM27_12605 [Paraburkholderia steynii]